MHKYLKAFIFLVGIFSTFSFPSKTLAEQRNVISSCELHTSAGDVRGKCVIKTHLEGNYIMIQVIPSWRKTPEDDELTYLRVENNPSCAGWNGFNEQGCKGEVWESTGWGYASIHDSEGKFSYGIGGPGFVLYYDGPLPRPSN